ncbi:MAG: ATP-dependent RecD-like DNA helicase [Bulleidia sp.]
MEDIRETVELTGKFTYILFHSESNFYTVARFLLHDESERMITVTGTLPDIVLDELYTVNGEYVEHPKYGMQFKIETFRKQLPSDRDAVVRYLSSVRFSGVGKKSAEKIVDSLGPDCLQMIKEDPMVLYQVPGLSVKVIDSIKDNIGKQDGMEELVSFLNIHGIGMRNLVRLNAAYGSDALKKIKENPYRVIEECDGMGFVTADKIGQALGIEKGDHRRLYAYLLALVSKICMDSGDSYVPYDELQESWHVKTKEYDDIFEELVDEGIMNRSLYREDDRIYPKAQYDAEITISSSLNRFPDEPFEPCDHEELMERLKKMEEETGITYDTLQVQAIESFFDSPLSIITGGPGTGKTTVVHAFMRLFHQMYPNAVAMCAAPTGRAAKRLCEVTGTQSTTIHSLLKWDLETNTFAKNEKDPVEVDLLIIDEFSMVDAFLFAALMKAGKKIRKICLIGDEDQLPSVGPGCVLRDLIASQRFPLVRLNHIYRQKDGSEVISLAHEIRNGEVHMDMYDRDVHFIPASDTQIRDLIIRYVNESLQEGYSMDEIQVLSPMYAGNVGIDVLNNALQETFNPPSQTRRELKSGYRTFREGDKILQLKNQPDDDVYNGDIGILEEIELPSESDDHKASLFVNYQDNMVMYKPENFDKITHAYCISVHKSQGGEYPVIIMPFISRHMIMLQRKLIYTAVTRAKKALYLIGDMNVFQKGIQCADRHVRRTTLEKRLHLIPNTD